MGDAAHCHLPTSANGACQAVEDAATVAICLEKVRQYLSSVSGSETDLLSHLLTLIHSRKEM
jgi:2-polyprenyl-6-methoxyphenol hydroxylase-like FAD-dependent oxidoreductase